MATERDRAPGGSSSLDCRSLPGQLVSSGALDAPEGLGGHVAIDPEVPQGSAKSLAPRGQLLHAFDPGVTQWAAEEVLEKTCAESLSVLERCLVDHGRDGGPRLGWSPLDEHCDEVVRPEMPVVARAFDR